MIRVLGDTERKETMENNIETDVIVNENENLQDLTTEAIVEIVDEVEETDVEPVTEIEPEATPEITEETTPEVEPEVIEEDEEETDTTGVVTATKLNVRELPNKDSNVVFVLNKDDVVMINTNSRQACEDFYEVYTADGKCGFCMKQFINLK